jgi:hypothetical protein
MIFKEVEKNPAPHHSVSAERRKTQKMLKHCFFFGRGLPDFLLLWGVLGPNFCEKQGMTVYAYQFFAQ